MALDTGAGGGLGEVDVAQIITVNFGERRVIDWGLEDRYAEAAARCELEALRQPADIADTLKRLAANYRKQGTGGH